MRYCDGKILNWSCVRSADKRQKRIIAAVEKNVKR